MKNCFKDWSQSCSFEHPKDMFKFMGKNNNIFRPGLKVIKLFPCLTQLSMKFIMLINVKMPTIVGILIFISVINATSERLKVRNFFICWYFSFYEQLKFRAQSS